MVEKCIRAIIYLHNYCKTRIINRQNTVRQKQKLYLKFVFNIWGGIYTRSLRGLSVP